MPGTNLTQQEAAERAALVAVHRYDVTLDLTVSDQTFTTVSRIALTALVPGAATFVDFVGERVEWVTVDGRPVDTAYDNGRIALPPLAGDSVVEIAAVGRYTNTGEGLHRFVDPADGEVYLYSQFEVADCRRMFPVFEQPDLKATFAFDVTAPAHWAVVSNSPTPEPEPINDEVARWRFAPTDVISCYITALVAGPYDVVHDVAHSRTGDIPMAIYCRKSLRPHLDPENIFEITKAGMAFFEEEFDQPYPFAKYDQIFTPEYNMGAMENVACVTFHEMYIFRTRVTDALVERRALTILHELAHMWFGNLVTMRWWDDLWLNESFAEWASTTCQAEATSWREAWTTFSSHEKDWAYRQDQLSTTHPIVAPIRDLRDVEVNFDGITYAKGASVLKQLVAYVGREPFRDGLRAYFAKHAWGNTTLDDLLTELEATSGRDLRAWSAVWLETAGVNTLTPRVDIGPDGRYRSVAIEQTYAAGFPTLRPHRLAVGLYREQEGALVRDQCIELDVAGALTDVPELVGVPAAELLLVNDDDLAYAKIRIDPASLAAVVDNPLAVRDSLPLSLVLASAWDMTRDGQMRASVFVDLALRALPAIGDSTMRRTVVTQLQTAISLYVDPARRADLRRDALTTCWRLLDEAPAGSDALLQLVGLTAALTSTGDDPARLTALLQGDAELPGLSVDTEIRWTLLTALAAAGVATDADIDAALADDPTATGRERAARARASRPDARAKESAWQSAVVDNSLSNSLVEATAVGFGRPGDTTALDAFVDRYHEMLATVEDKGSQAVVEAVVRGFYPRALANRRLLDATDTWLADHPDAAPALRRLVVENRDGVERALTAQRVDAQEL